MRGFPNCLKKYHSTNLAPITSKRHFVRGPRRSEPKTCYYSRQLTHHLAPNASPRLPYLPLSLRLAITSNKLRGLVGPGPRPSQSPPDARAPRVYPEDWISGGAYDSAYGARTDDFQDFFMVRYCQWVVRYWVTTLIHGLTTPALAFSRLVPVHDDARGGRPECEATQERTSPVPALAINTISRSTSSGNVATNAAAIAPPIWPVQARGRFRRLPFVESIVTSEMLRVRASGPPVIRGSAHQKTAETRRKRYASDSVQLYTTMTHVGDPSPPPIRVLTVRGTGRQNGKRSASSSIQGTHNPLAPPASSSRLRAMLVAVFRRELPPGSEYVGPNTLAEVVEEQGARHDAVWTHSDTVGLAMLLFFEARPTPESVLCICEGSTSVTISSDVARSIKTFATAHNWLREGGESNRGWVSVDIISLESSSAAKGDLLIIIVSTFAHLTIICAATRATALGFHTMALTIRSSMKPRLPCQRKHAHGTQFQHHDRCLNGGRNNQECRPPVFAPFATVAIWRYCSQQTGPRSQRHCWGKRGTKFGAGSVLRFVNGIYKQLWAFNLPYAAGRAWRPSGARVKRYNRQRRGRGPGRIYETALTAIAR
ncbi:hypothetical protein GGX14DRAFT_659579 [Mycena pura]|uniref:Uncharacterized protein n=1 Tax=Mycena pura TaxID=153505 RepID=A0AAD6V662_9AGAR|nr:hypothetical protein GGX14DRAFT_659579 [Mycena pura]